MKRVTNNYSLKDLKDAQGAHGLRNLQGVQALILGLLTSFGLSAIISGAFFSDSAYAAYSASISRTSSGTITLSDGSGSSIKPSSTGTLGTGSDTVSVSSNCTAGYNLYVSAISGGSTNLSTDGGTDYIPSTTTATGSEATLTKDTWGVGKNGSTFSKLPAYSTDASTWTALYTGTGDASSTKQNYTVYYGANVSTAKTPGTYTGDVLYTVIMNSACEKWTLKFDDNGADVNNLTDQELDFDSTINLATISSSDKIAKTGYTLTGWKDQNGNTYGTSGTVDVNTADAATVTLTAQWGINSHTVTITKGSNVSTVTASDGTTTKTDTALTADYNKTITIAATAFSTGYHFSGWTVTSGGVTLYSNSAMTTQSTTTTPAYFRMPDANVAITAAAAANTYTIKYAAGSTGGSCSVSDTAATYDQDVKLSDTVCTKSGAEQKGWSTTNSATNTKTYDLGATLVKPNLTSTNGGSVTLYPYFENTAAYMQSTSCSSLTVSTTTTLVDSRDNQEYTIYRWPSSGTAGTAYPTAMAGYCIMTKDLSLGYVTGGSITKGSNLVLSTDDSAGSTTSSAPIYARTGTSDWSTTNADSNLQYINGTNATYGTHAYYSYGAAQKVCPKGWRPPTNTEYGNIKTFMGGNNSTGSSKIRGTPYNFVYGGLFYSGGWYYVGSYGYYWSSTQYDSSYGYSLYFLSSTLDTRYYGKNLGMSVRCVAAP